MGTSDRIIKYEQKLTNVAANAAESSRTIELDVEECVSITVYYKVTQSAGTAATIIGYGSPDDGTNYFRIQSSTVASGTGALDDFTWSNAISGNELFKAGFDCATDTKFKLILGITPEGASDKIDAWIIGSLV